MGHQNLYGRNAVREAGVGKSVSSVRCTRLPARYIREERRTHRTTHAMIVNSAAIRDELETRAGIERARIDVIENGVDTERFRPLDDAERRVERTRFAMSARTLVVPGRISAQKNQLGVVRALWALRRSGELPSDARVLFAGRQEAHTRYGAWVRWAIALAGLGETVKMIGVVKDVERLLAAADAILMPSKFEGLPNAVLEALACGTPAIVSRVANADRLVGDGISGWCLDGDGWSSIASGLRRFFASSDANRRTLGEAGRREVAERFTLARMVERTCTVYERVLGD
jgi:glycosyltransferase involved in cell wall biosynthesis